MSKRLLVIAEIIVLMFVTINAFGEHGSWNCPGCGRTNNTGNYCGSCAHPAPWINQTQIHESTSAVVVQNNHALLTIDKTQSFGRNRFVAAGDRYAVAVKKDGTCAYTAQAPNISNWKNIVYICSSKNQVAGIKKDGSVVCSDSSLKVSQWTNVEMIEYASNFFSNDQHIVALTKKGTVLATGTNRYGECNTEKWGNIVDISAGYLHTVALRNDGTVMAIGDNSAGQCNVEEWTDIVDVAAARFSTYGLKSNGQIVVAGCKKVDDNSKKPASAPQWDNVVAIIADNEGGSACDYLIGIKEDGTIVSDREGYVTAKEIQSFSDVVSVGCASWGYTIISDSNGRVYDIGWDVDGQRITNKWTNIKTPDD